MTKEDKQLLAQLVTEREQLGFRYFSCLFRNTPAVCRKHPTRSVVAGALILASFVGVWLACRRILPPEEFARFAEIPACITALFLVVSFLVAQTDRFVEDWTVDRELANEYSRLSKKIIELMRS
jgi:hypothetical protein